MKPGKGRRNRSPTAREVDDARLDVDYEMEQLVKLHQEIICPQCRYPDIIWHAIRVAYAAHFRVLLEFFHGGRPHPPPPKGTDLWYSDYLARVGISNQKPFYYSQRREQRLDDADKLLAHLTVERQHRRRRRREWGDPADQALIEWMIRDLLKRIPNGSRQFQRTWSALQALDGLRP